MQDATGDTPSPNTAHPGDAYILRRRIGGGGMGVVYEAWDARLERVVALKLLHPHLLAEERHAQRLEREARLAARIDHPNVVHVNRIDRVEGQLVIEMQLIEGTPLHDLLHRGPLPIAEAVQLLHQILLALAACHAQGVLHLDLKPGNLLVTPVGHVYLTDFGIARAAMEQQAEAGLDSGPLWGTPRYSPPEAWQGEPPTQQWDLYAAGIVVREALLGRSALETATPEMLMRQKLEGDLPDIALALPALSQGLASLLNELVAPRPQDRPTGALAALRLLEATPEFNDAETPTVELPVPAPAKQSADKELPRPEGGQRRRALAVALVALVLGTAYFLNPWREVSAPGPVPGGAAVESASIEGLTISGNAAYFSYDDGEHGRELWMLSTVSRTVELVGDIAPGEASSNPGRLLSCEAGTVVFAATTPELGEELWACGLGFLERPEYRLVKDILPGPMSSEPLPLASQEHLVLLYATTLTQGRELWCTAGNAARTGLVADLIPGALNSQPMDPRTLRAGPGVYLIAYGGNRLGMHLWRYQFGENTIEGIADVDENTGSMVLLGQSLILSNRDPLHGFELWKHEVDTKNLELLADLWPGPDSSSPGQYFVFKDFLLFHACTLETGVELWRTNGTAVDTHPIADIRPGKEGSDPNAFVAVGDQVFFRADDGRHGRELWVTDGTQAGTRLAADVWPGPEASTPYNLSAQGNLLFFSANDGVHGEELWMLDASREGGKPEMVADLLPGPESSEPHGLQWAHADLGVLVARTARGQQLFMLQPKSSTERLEAIPLPGQQQSAPGETP